MPNHCYCELRIKGNPQRIENFFQSVKGVEKLIDEALILPYPKKYQDQDDKAKAHNEKVYKTGKGKPIKDGYNSGGYEWCVENWGTKWGMYDFSEVKFFQQSAVVRFFTAWSPPLPLILKMGEMFPRLQFTLRYYEGGAGFKGVYSVKQGQNILDESEDYSGNRGG